MNVSWNSAGPLTIAAEARRARVTPLGGTREVLNPEGLAQLMRPSSHAFVPAAPRLSGGSNCALWDSGVPQRAVTFQHATRTDESHVRRSLGTGRECRLHRWKPAVATQLDRPRVVFLPPLVMLRWWNGPRRQTMSENIQEVLR